MKDKFKLRVLDLTIFDEGGGAPEPASTPVSETTGIGNQTKTGETVLYGKQPDDSLDAGGEQPKELPPEEPIVDKKSQFEELIKGDYKDIFGERVQSIINQRFKAEKQAESQLQSINPLLDMMYSKYNVKQGDYDGLTRAIEGDNQYWESAAEEMGLTVEQYKNFKKMERENNQLRQVQQEAEVRQKMNQTYNNWLQQASEMKEAYPEFNLDNELQNRDFLGLLKSNISVKQAYEVLHMDDIKQNIAKDTAKKVESNVTNTIRTNGQRAKEAGLSQQSGIIVKNDVSKLTRADRAEIARRVARGEDVKF